MRIVGLNHLDRNVAPHRIVTQSAVRVRLPSDRPKAIARAWPWITALLAGALAALGGHLMLPLELTIFEFEFAL
jgi:hypothetical protein